MDIFDRATALEERERAACVAAVRAAPQRDFEAEICEGCSYAVQGPSGKACDAWAECLTDLVRRERRQ